MIKAMQVLSRLRQSVFSKCYVKNIAQFSFVYTSNNIETKATNQKSYSSTFTRTKVASSYDDDLEITSAINNERKVSITWEDGTKCSFPHIFLRDNCTCPKCLHSESGSRTLHTFKDVDLNIIAKSVTMRNNQVLIEWPDNHTSTFDSSWLYERNFPTERKSTRDNVPFGLKQKLWNKEILSKDPPFIEFEDWLNKETSVMKHIERLITHGVCIIRGAPAEENFSDFISKHMAMGFNKWTHYGPKEIMKSKVNVSNIAYTGLDLSLHNDMAYLKNQPDMQFLHCIEQSSEGETGSSLVVDGFYVANQLRKENPEAFNLLTTTVFPANDIGVDRQGEFHMFYQRPIIRVDDHGDLVGMCFNNYSRSSFVYAPANEVFDIYKALYALYEQLNKKENIWSYKLKPGDILTFANKRILHGRLGFDPAKTSRWLETGYLDWDNVLGKYRVLRARNNYE